MAGGIALERLFEPGQRGDQPILAADHLAAHDQRVDRAGRELDRTVRSLGGAEKVAGGEAEAGDIGPEAGIVGCEMQGLVEGALRAGIVAGRGQRPRADAQPIGAQLLRRLVGLGGRLVGLALKHPCLGAPLRHGRGVVAGIDRALDLSLGADAVLQREQCAREDDMGVPIVGVAAHRFRREIACAVGVVGLEHRLGALGGLGGFGLAHPAGGQREPADQHGEQHRQRDADHQHAAHAEARGSGAGAPMAGGHRPSSGHRGWGG